MTRRLDGKTNGDGSVWPKWWDDDNPPNINVEFGSVCVICERMIVPDEQHAWARGADFDADVASGFCLCQRCVRQWGRYPSNRTIGRHDRAVIHRFTAVYNRLRWEIMNGKRAGQHWSAIGTIQPR